MIQIKAEHESFIEFEEYPGDSFIDSLLNFDDWVEHNPISSSSPIFGKMNNTSEKEEIFGPEKLAEDLNCCSLIQEEMGKVFLTVAGADVDVTDGGESNMKNGDVKQQDVSDDGGVNIENHTVKDGGENSLKNDVKPMVLSDADGVNDDENEVKNDVVKDSGDLEDSDTSEEESSPSSSSESSSSSDDDDDDDDSDDDYDNDDGEGGKEVKVEVEMEEGEINEEVAAVWSDDEGGGDAVKGPIRSKNEVQDLPPVPPVNVTIQPHHQTLPVGVVLSIMGTQVIVEGVDNHNPLSEGSILWITESRSPLGVVDEIFGPVKNPYYIVRYNAESEIPTGIQQGSSISFVPEFADYVLNNNSLYKKGYDASGENDEELSEELEFSDDEKEAEYKKMIKMSKRNSSEQKFGHMKKDKKSRNRGGNWKNDHQPSGNSQVNGSSSRPQAFSPSQVNGGPQAFSPAQVNCSSIGPTSGPQAFSPGPQAPNFTGMPSGVWPNGFSSMQPQNIGPPNGFPSNVPFMQQNFAQQPFQNIGLANLGPFPLQFNTNAPMFPYNNFVQGVPPNFGANPSFASWPAGMPQNNFNPSQVGLPMVFQGLPQGVAMPNGLQMENTGATRPPFVGGNGEATEDSNQGNGFPNRGKRKPFQRGGGRFRGGRGGRSGPRSR